MGRPSSRAVQRAAYIQRPTSLAQVPRVSWTSRASRLAILTCPTAYLPPPEVARQIPCRYFPNCAYADKCIFLHPQPQSVPGPTLESQPVPQEMGQYQSGSLPGVMENGAEMMVPAENGGDAEYGMANGMGQPGFGPVHAMNGMPIYHAGYGQQPYQGVFYPGYPGQVLGPQPPYPASPAGTGSSSPANGNINGASPALPTSPVGNMLGLPSPQGSHFAGLPMPMQMQMPYYAMPGPQDIQQLQYMYASHPEAIRAQQQAHAQAQAQAQLELEFAKASQQSAHHRNPSAGGQGHMNGHARSSSASVVPRHERSHSSSQPAPINGGQMHTFFQTGGNANGEDASPVLAQSFKGSPSFQMNGLANGTLSPPMPRNKELGGPSSYNGPSHVAQRGRDFPPADGAAANGRIAGHNKRASFGGFASTRFQKPQGERETARRNYVLDPSKPTPSCNYFTRGDCRYGDNCHFVHLLDEERELPAQSVSDTNPATGNAVEQKEGEDQATASLPVKTRDARALKMNIGYPNGDVASWNPRNSNSTNHAFSNGHPHISSHASVELRASRFQGPPNSRYNHTSRERGNSINGAPYVPQQPSHAPSTLR